MFKLYTNNNPGWAEFILFFAAPQCHCLVILYRNQKENLKAWVLKGVQECSTFILTYDHSEQHDAEVCTQCCQHSSHLALSRCYRGKRKTEVTNHI